MRNKKNNLQNYGENQCKHKAHVYEWPHTWQFFEYARWLSHLGNTKYRDNKVKSPLQSPPMVGSLGSIAGGLDSHTATSKESMHCNG
jgi:hypothetical protein